MNNKKNIFILRHDVDSPFVYRKSNTKKFLNRIFLSSPELPGKEKLPGYLEALEYTLKLEKQFNAKGTFFLRTVTCPSKNLVQKILKDGHELGFHADRINTLEEFQKDLNFIQKKIEHSIQGFSKHGFAKIRSGGAWNEQKMIEYAISSNLNYLAQGVDHPDWEKPKQITGVYVFGHHLTIKDATFEDMKKYIQSNSWPMLMLHPEDLYIDGVEDKFINILKMANAISVKDALNQMV
jgi:peptidoglycan/xylan/chitin deacetylase (PgdA/CDA1 family)